MHCALFLCAVPDVWHTRLLTSHLYGFAFLFMLHEFKGINNISRIVFGSVEAVMNFGASMVKPI